MNNTIDKLRPDRDLQCFFFEPSAIAALSATSENGFTVSGTWRQQFDWAVIEWNRDNTYEHPAFRYLPDGDLSELILTYEESRTNCIPMDSDLFATVDWPSLRVFADDIYYVTLRDHATPIEGSYQSAYADFTLLGTVAGGDFVGLAFFNEHYTYQLYGVDTLETTVQALVDSVNAFSTLLKATRTGTTIRVYYTAGQPLDTSTAGANGNRFGIYSYTTGAETWDSLEKTLTGGTSPTKWSVTLDFGSLMDRDGRTVPTNNVRKVRWTYSADLQPGEFARSEFEVVVSNWTVTGTNRTYSVAGPGSRRIEDHAAAIVYSGHWMQSRGNYSGGTIHHTVTLGDSFTYTYHATQAHTLYLGTRYTGAGAQASITMDGASAGAVNLLMPAEDVLIRWPVGQYEAGSHTITATHAGPDGNDFYFDFIELASPTAELPVFPPEPRITLATDWDTEHSLALAPERTAWFIHSLGFMGRQNHYVGALWFYDLVRTGHSYASGTVTFSGTPQPNFFVTITLGRTDQPTLDDTILTKLIHVGDTADTIATVLTIELNRGYTGLWASASGDVVTIYSRSMGTDGNKITLAASTTSSGFTATASGVRFAGGVDGDWRTDLTATPRLNRAVRDWSYSFFAALAGYGIDSAAAFSMELGNGDPSAAVGIAQVGPGGDPIVLPTPSLQTNFSPASLAFWQGTYAEMAGIQAAAGLTPYLQFGEVQWWYFPNDGAGHDYSGMPFYDAWNQAQFLATYGHPMAVITTNTVNPADYPDEAAYLPVVIGVFTNAVMSFVRTSQESCRFEVLYPTDVNQTSFNLAINYPVAAWTPTALVCLKTESFGFTFGRDLNKAESTIDFGHALGFQATQRSQLVGVGDSTTAWVKEAQIALGKGLESVVLFALDQFCLIGYEAPLRTGLRRSVRMG